MTRTAVLAAALCLAGLPVAAAGGPVPVTDAGTDALADPALLASASDDVWETVGPIPDPLCAVPTSLLPEPLRLEPTNCVCQSGPSDVPASPRPGELTFTLPWVGPPYYIVCVR